MVVVVYSIKEISIFFQGGGEDQVPIEISAKTFILVYRRETRNAQNWSKTTMEQDFFFGNGPTEIRAAFSVWYLQKQFRSGPTDSSNIKASQAHFCLQIILTCSANQFCTLFDLNIHFQNLFPTGLRGISITQLVGDWLRY